MVMFDHNLLNFCRKMNHFLSMNLLVMTELRKLMVICSQIWGLPNKMLGQVLTIGSIGKLKVGFRELPAGYIINQLTHFGSILNAIAMWNTF